jgi:uncharacterized protein YecE (DUF72 family)
VDFVHHYDKWWQHDEAWERYDYSCTDEELMEWLPKIGQLDEAAPLTLVYMNNHTTSKGDQGASVTMAPSSHNGSTPYCSRSWHVRSRT